jgi:hypothetical protein
MAAKKESKTETLSTDILDRLLSDNDPMAIADKYKAIFGMTAETEPKAKTTLLNILEQLLSGDPKPLISQLNTSFDVMDETDYCMKIGLNEAGFKGLVIGALAPFMGTGISMRSEVKMGSNIMDLVIETKDMCMGIELKYTPLPFTDRANFSKYDPTLYIRRTHLHNRKIAIQGMDEKELLELTVTTGAISTINKRLIQKPISFWLQAAKEQAAKCMAQFMTTSASKRVIVLYGIGPRVIYCL